MQLAPKPDLNRTSAPKSYVRVHTCSLLDVNALAGEKADSDECGSLGALKRRLMLSLLRMVVVSPARLWWRVASRVPVGR